jgi:uncharacterized alpha-E superfamily protein
MLSRVADSLYWMSRYLERAEHTARLLDVNLQGALDEEANEHAPRWERLLQTLEFPREKDDPFVPDAREVTRRLGFDTTHQGFSIKTCVALARENARQVRNEISSEMWEGVNRLFLSLRDTTLEAIWKDQPHEYFQQVREGVQHFQGITDSTLSHSEGWRFLQTGRFVERACATTTLLVVHANSPAFRAAEHQHDAADYLEMITLLRSCSASEVYTRLYTAEVKPSRIAELLILAEDFPRSIHYCVHRLQRALDHIADETETRRNAKPNRMAGKLLAMLSFESIDEVLGRGLVPYLTSVHTQCEAIHTAMHDLYIGYPTDKALLEA